MWEERLLRDSSVWEKVMRANMIPQFLIIYLGLMTPLVLVRILRVGVTETAGKYVSKQRRDAAQ